MNKLKISEIFYSIQGETSYVGRPAIFIRLAGCNLSCRWCDTAYSRNQGRLMAISAIIRETKKYPARLVIITGGEPLLQDALEDLINELNKLDYTMLIETNGSRKIPKYIDGVKVIIDIKTPSSGYMDSIDVSNLQKLKKEDEVKFVISDYADFSWSKKFIKEKNIEDREILFSPVKGRLSFKRLAEWVKEDCPFSRLQFNIHKTYGIK